ncbi:MAG: hypothetical protein ACRDV2_02480 [Actinomycetes bacterium]
MARPDPLERPKPDPPDRWVGLLVAVVVIVATHFYHVQWWTEFAK